MIEINDYKGLNIFILLLFKNKKYLLYLIYCYFFVNFLCMWFCGGVYKYFLVYDYGNVIVEVYMVFIIVLESEVLSMKKKN